MRRTLGPAALHYLTDRPPTHPVIGGNSASAPPDSNVSDLPPTRNAAAARSNSTPIALDAHNSPSSPQPPPVTEKLTDNDRQQLDSILREKAK